jgi:hypothetical protein
VANAEINFDATNKLRTSSPQALIDTDFEYGSQVTKWENLALTNNRPYAFTSATPVTITDVTITNRTVTVLTSSPPAVGTPIVVSDTYLTIANGTFVVETVSSGTNFTYTARATTTLAGGTSIFDSNKTSVSTGTFYTASAINDTSLTGTTSTVLANSITSDNALGASKITVTLTATNAHGLSVGNEIQVYSATASGAIGAFFVSQVNSPTSFSYHARSQVATAIGGVTDVKVYARTQGSVLHRPYDGGVIFSSNAGSNYEQQIRQTRRYFRYQSGKGIQMSSGTILKPNFQVDSLSYSASTGLVTVVLKDMHNIQTVPPDTQITISGANEAGFNGTFFVASVTGYNTFNYAVPSGVFSADTSASGNYYVSTSNWWGAVNRLGIFDQQNGLFFEFDGQQLYAVRRNSTYQLSGRVNVVKGSTNVARGSAPFNTTAFSKQVVPGDFIVIKGQSYRVDSIASDSSLTIAPAYRGASANQVIVSKTVDTKIPQSQWNLDTMDGKGPSGYKLDLTKMQMFYIDYSWYGAGFVRWGLRGSNGDVMYVHKMANNNINAEAYMRSGNLPGRYETGTIPPITVINSSVATSDTTISVADTSNFPFSGTLAIKSDSTLEHVYYNGKASNSFTNVVRAKAGAAGLTSTIATTSNSGSVSSNANVQVGQRVISTTANAVSDGTFVTAVTGTQGVTLSQPPLSANPPLTFVPMSATTGQAFTYSATAPTAVELAYPTLAPTLSHWGTSVIMDGRFDDDKSLLFTYGQVQDTTVAASTEKVVLSIRVAPSVDNGKPGAFGSRELINRMQLVLRTLDITTLSTSTTPLLVKLNLNGVTSASTSWIPVPTPSSSLAQIADHGASGTAITNGESIGGFFVNGTSQIDLALVRDLGNAILGGGGTTSNTQIYPDGPDVIHISVTNLNATNAAVIRTRLAWTEAQA